MTFSSIKINENATVMRSDRSMSNGRLFSSAVSLILGIFLVYTSIFYVPAFINVRGFFGISDSHPMAKSKSSKSPIQPLVDLLNMDRAYLTAGQGVDVLYNIESGTRAELIFYKCQSMPILEVFNCNPTIVDRIPIKNTRKGLKSLKVKNNGFYAFEVVTVSAPSKYQVAWQRRY